MTRSTPPQGASLPSASSCVANNKPLVLNRVRVRVRECRDSDADHTKVSVVMYSLVTGLPLRMTYSSRLLTWTSTVPRPSHRS